MQFKTTITASLLLGLALPLAGWSADLYLIANTDFALSDEELREVFVGDRQIAGGIRLLPLDNASLQKDFVEKVLKMDGLSYNVIWTKKGFREGLNPPPLKSGDAEVIATVKATPGAVGYVSSAPEGVKFIRKY